jgi:membrane protease YdiL (CAAX protease family)
VNAYSLKREKQKLLLRYLITIPVSVMLVFVFPRFEQFTDLRRWYLLPVWVSLAHFSCALSNLITYRSVRSSWHLIRSTFLIYWKRTSVVHLQSAFLTALLEEMLFRYVLLNLLVDVTGSIVWAVALDSITFTVTHLVFNRGFRRFTHALDLLFFSILIAGLNLLTASFYPALIVHWMRDYILRVLLIKSEG